MIGVVFRVLLGLLVITIMTEVILLIFKLASVLFVKHLALVGISAAIVTLLCFSFSVGSFIMHILGEHT